MKTWQQISGKKDALRIFIPLLLLYAASYFQRTALPGTIYQDLQADFKVDAEQIACISAAFVYAYSLPQLFVGMLIDRFCGSRVVACGGIILAIGALWMPFCDTMTTVYISRAVTGLGASTMYLALVKESDRLFGRENYALMIGIAYFVGYGGGLCGKLPFALACSHFPWRHVLIGAGVLTLLFYLFFMWSKSGVKMPEIPRTKFSFSPLKRIVSNPFSWLLCFCSSVIFCVYFTIQTVFGEKFLRDFTGMSSTAAAGVTFIMTLICMFIMLNTKYLLRFSGNRRRPLVSAIAGLCFCNALLMSAGIFFHMPTWYFTVVFCLFAVSAGAPPVFTMVMQELNSRDAMTQATSICNLTGYLSVAVFAPVTGLVLEKIGGSEVNGEMIFSTTAYLTVFLAVSAIAGTAFVLSFLLPETRGHYLHLHS